MEDSDLLGLFIVHIIVHWPNIDKVKCLRVPPRVVNDIRSGAILESPLTALRLFPLHDVRATTTTRAAAVGCLLARTKIGNKYKQQPRKEMNGTDWRILDPEFGSYQKKCPSPYITPTNPQSTASL